MVKSFEKDEIEAQNIELNTPRERVGRDRGRERVPDTGCI